MESPRRMNHLSSASTVRKKAWVETYGCQMNVSDGELMQGILAGAGYDIAATPDDADVVLVNTCAIRDHAEQRVIGRVGDLYRLKAARPDMVIGVTGCMAQRLGQKLLDRAAYVDLVMGPDGYRRLPEVLAGLRPGQATAEVATAPEPRRGALPVIAAPTAEERVTVLEFRAEENYEGLEIKRASKVTAWVPVQRGCDHRCTYCIVPYTRGP